MSATDHELLLELFTWVRELMPATPDNMARQAQWAAKFHEGDAPVADANAEPLPDADAEHDPDDDLAVDDDDEPPAAHTAPKPKSKPRKKR